MDVKYFLNESYSKEFEISEMDAIKNREYFFKAFLIKIELNFLTLILSR